MASHIPYDISLTPEEEANLRQILSSVLPGSEGREVRAEIRQVLRRWRRVVDMVESTYTMTEDDYGLQIGSREVIQRILDLSPPSLRRKLEVPVMALDARFYESTIEVGVPFRLNLNKEDSPWLWRIPKRYDPHDFKWPH